jgi:hypothetical protein
MAERISIEGLNAYEQATLEEAFAKAGLDANVAFDQPRRDPQRPGAIDMWTAIVDLGEPALLVVAAWILKTRRKITKIRKPDGTVVEYRQESFVSGAAVEALKGLKATLSRDNPA